MAITGTPKARLGAYGGPRQVYGDFAPKAEGAPTPVADTVSGGGKSKYARRKYPRWVMVNGQRYRVKNPDEERQLLQAVADRARDDAKVAEALGDAETAVAAERRRIRIEKRVAKVDSRENEWLGRLREEDEEILLILQ